MFSHRPYTVHSSSQDEAIPRHCRCSSLCLMVGYLLALLTLLDQQNTSTEQLLCSLSISIHHQPTPQDLHLFTPSHRLSLQLHNHILQFLDSLLPSVSLLKSILFNLSCHSLSRASCGRNRRKFRG